MNGKYYFEGDSNMKINLHAADWYSMFISFLSLLGTIGTLSQILFIPAKNARRIKTPIYANCKDAILIKDSASANKGLSLLVLAFINQIISSLKIVYDYCDLKWALKMNIIAFILGYLALGFYYNYELEKCIEDARKTAKESLKRLDDQKELYQKEDYEKFKKVIEYPYEKNLYKYFKIRKFLWFLSKKEKMLIREVNNEKNEE